MLSFLKSLCFWRYRTLYLAQLYFNAETARELMRHRERADCAFAELRRLRTILAPYGEMILTGQSRDDDFEMGRPINLPVLEFEMAKAHLHETARMPTSVEFDLLTAGFDCYSWRSRPIQVVQ